MCNVWKMVYYIIFIDLLVLWVMMVIRFYCCCCCCADHSTQSTEMIQWYAVAPLIFIQIKLINKKNHNDKRYDNDVVRHYSLKNTHTHTNAVLDCPISTIGTNRFLKKKTNHIPYVEFQKIGITIGY